MMAVESTLFTITQNPQPIGPGRAGKECIFRSAKENTVTVYVGGQHAQEFPLYPGETFNPSILGSEGVVYARTASGTATVVRFGKA